MNLEIKLPLLYKPFSILNFCSNRLVNVEIPIMIDEHLILLVGRGHTPRVWLSVPVDSQARIWTYIVSNNSPRNISIKVEQPQNKGPIIIKYLNNTILDVLKINHNYAMIRSIDLRELGVNIYGDGNNLIVGDGKLVNNSFTNIKVAFALSVREGVPTG